ncbi:uncharacterized, partial [Tachysurus ichikawai]
MEKSMETDEHETVTDARDEAAINTAVVTVCYREESSPFGQVLSNSCQSTRIRSQELFRQS